MRNNSLCRDFVLEARESWRRLPGEQRTVYGLVAANVMVHLMWRTPSLAPFMLRHFTQVLALLACDLPVLHAVERPAANPVCTL